MLVSIPRIYQLGWNYKHTCVLKNLIRIISFEVKNVSIRIQNNKDQLKYSKNLKE